jgi:threonine aldolase
MPPPPIDLRSDTVTRPDAEMRRAMAEAEVGDDVFGEDPTVARLEAEGAAAVGQEAALFTPSGTMGNQIALHLHGRPGGEVVCELQSHIVVYEMAAMAAISGLLPRVLPGDRGRLDPAAVEAAINPEVTYRSRTVAIAVENTHNLAGGSVYRRPQLAALIEVARRRRLPIHLDGARLFNAAVALGVPAADLAQGFDSVMISLSKGLGAPVGSLLCGSRQLIGEARRVRKMLGGGMRQVGVLAAAGRIALRDGPGWLAEDHANAAYLAGELAALGGVEIDPATVETNIVVARVTDAVLGGAPPAPEDGPAPAAPPAPADGPALRFLARAAEAGVLAVPLSRDRVRFVTHRDAPRARVEEAVRRLRSITACA